MKVPETHDEIVRHLEALSNLLGSEGWNYILEYLEDLEKSLTREIYTAPDSHKMAVIAGGLRMLIELRELPTQRARAYRASLDNQ